jgi:uroporphyrin-III C-methyltransferase
MLQSHQSHSLVPHPGETRRAAKRAPAFEPGEVWLVGAGPGDPGLLSLMAADALRAADAVVFDSWIDPAILELVPAGCYLEGRGGRDRRASDHGAVTRSVELARQGWRVVRLMDGDPLMSGDGAGEALALVEAGVRFRIVPGIPARIAGLSYGGVPVTHRGLSSAVCFIDLELESDPRAPRSDVESIVRAAPTLVFRLHPEQTAALTQRLLDAGLPPSSDAILVVRPGSARQEVIETTIAGAAARAGALGPDDRLILGLGPCLALRRQLDQAQPGAVDAAAVVAAPLQFSMAGAG